MNRTGRRTGGFTLIELLVGVALLAVVLTAVLNLNLSTTRSSSALQTRNDLLAETQTAQNYVAGKLRDATYIFPTGTTLVLGGAAPGDSSTRKPGTTSGTWTVGTDPVIAFVTPPRVAGTCSAANRDSCYTFYAYYPVQRDVITAGTTGVNNPGADSANDSSAWVLMEYRRAYTGTVAALGTALAGGISGETARMVLDYLRPPAAGESLFSQVDSTTPGVGSVTVNLASRRVGAGTTNVPPAGRYSVTVYPRNVGKSVVPN